MLQHVLADKERNIGIHNLDSDPCHLLPKFDWNRYLFLCSVKVGWSEPKVYIAWILINFIFFSLAPETVSEGREPKAAGNRQRTSTVHHTLVGSASEVDIVLNLVYVCVSELKLFTDKGGLLSILAPTVFIVPPFS